MLPYLAFGRAAFQRQLAYRSANWAGLFTNVFFLIFRVYALRACYKHQTTVGGFSQQEMSTYITMTQALLMVAPQWGNLGLSDSVRTGQVALDLFRPANLFGMHMAQRLAVSMYYIFARAIPILLTGYILGFVGLSFSIRGSISVVISVLLGAWIGICMLFLIELSSFWLETDKGVRTLFVAALVLPSGLSLPVDFLSEGLRAWIYWTPFIHILHSPTIIWQERVTGPALFELLGTQLLWVVLLTIACQGLLARATRKLQVFGG